MITQSQHSNFLIWNTTLLQKMQDIMPINLWKQEQGKPKKWHWISKSNKSFNIPEQVQKAATQQRLQWHITLLCIVNCFQTIFVKHCIMHVTEAAGLKNKTMFENMSLSQIIVWHMEKWWFNNRVKWYILLGNVGWQYRHKWHTSTADIYTR